MKLRQFVGRRLAEKRRERQLDTAALARALGVSEIQLKAWEEGTKRVPSLALIAAAEVLHCKVSYFFEGEPLSPYRLGRLLATDTCWPWPSFSLNRETNLSSERP